MIKVILPHSSKIQYFAFTGENGSVVSTNGKLILSRGRMYKVPVDTHDSLDQHNVIKLIGKVAEMLDIRNIENGYAMINPIIHNVILHDNMELGNFI